MSDENLDAKNNNLYPSLDEPVIPDIEGLIISPKKKADNVEIKVPKTNIIEETFKKHVTYTIKGHDKEGDFEVIRRYSAFDKIRALLLIRWPGCYIPPLPPKSLMSNLDQRFIESRRKNLEKFLNRIADFPYLYNSEEFLLFLKSPGADMEKIYAQLSKPAPEDMITRYATTFSHLSGKELNNEVVIKINSFKVFLQKTQGHFENFKKITENVTKARREFYNQLGQFHNQVCVKYEQEIFSEYHGHNTEKNVFYDPSNFVLHDRAEKIANAAAEPSLEYMYEWIKTECREIEAILEAISSRDKFEVLKNKAHEKQKSDTDTLQKVLAGNFSMKTMFSRKTKEDEARGLEESIAKANKEMQDYAMLYDMITLLIGHCELEKFREDKLPTYHYVVRMSAEAELANVRNMIDYWSVVMRSDNVKPPS